MDGEKGARQLKAAVGLSAPSLVSRWCSLERVFSRASGVEVHVLITARRAQTARPAHATARPPGRLEQGSSEHLRRFTSDGAFSHVYYNRANSRGDIHQSAS